MKKRIASVFTAVLVTISLIALMSVSALSETELKYQISDLKDGTFAVRFILIADEKDVKYVTGASVYLSVPEEGDTETVTIRKAYKSIIAGGKTITAGDGKVFLIVKFVGIPENMLNGITGHFKYGNNVAQRKIIYNAFHKFSFPKGFDKISSKIKLQTDGCTFKYDFDITQYKNTGGTTYYVAPDAPAVQYPTENNPTNFKYLLLRKNGALKDGDTVIFADGVYRDIVSSGVQNINKSINLIAKNPGKVTLANVGAKLTYSHKGNGVYTTARSTVVKVVQKLDNKFTTTELKKVGSAKECSQEGTWFKDSRNVLYVHLFDDAKPTYENCFVLLDYKTPVINVANANKAVKLYLEGINFVGGTPSTVLFEGSKGYTSTLYAKDCKFVHAYDSRLSRDAVSIRGADAFFVNCYAGFSSKDGFNYHATNGYVPSFIEINCIGANNGIDGVAKGQPWQNGTTAHDGVKGLRIGGTYYNNYGGNVADVHQGTETVNINCFAHDSAYTGSNALVNADFVAQQAGAVMHIYNCKAHGSMTAMGAVTGAKIIIY